MPRFTRPLVNNALIFEKGNDFRFLIFSYRYVPGPAKAVVKVGKFLWPIILAFIKEMFTVISY